MNKLKQIYSLLKKNKKNQSSPDSIHLYFKGEEIIIEKQSLVEGLNLFFELGEGLEEINFEKEIFLEDLTKTLYQKKGELPLKNKDRFLKSEEALKPKRNEDDLLGDLVKITSGEKKHNLLENVLPQKKVPNWALITGIFSIVIFVYLVIPKENKGVAPRSVTTTSQESGLAPSNPSKPTSINKNKFRPSAPRKNKSQRSRFRLQAKEIPRPKIAPNKKRVPSSSEAKDTKEKSNQRTTAKLDNYALEDQTIIAEENEDIYEDKVYDNFEQDENVSTSDQVEENYNRDPYPPEEQYEIQEAEEGLLETDPYAEESPDNERNPNIDPY